MKYFICFMLFPQVAVADQTSSDVDYAQYVTEENVCIATKVLFNVITCPNEYTNAFEPAQPSN